MKSVSIAASRAAHADLHYSRSGPEVLVNKKLKQAQRLYEKPAGAHCIYAAIGGALKQRREPGQKGCH
jgi:hypothetical protein